MGDIVKNPKDALTGGALGSLVGGVGPFGALVGSKVGGKKILGGLGDALLGKKDPGTSDELINLYTDEQKQLLGNATSQYADLLGKNSQMADVQGAQMERQVIANSEDQERQARQQVAQRGLGNSSVGLSAVLGAKSNVGDKVADIRANMPNMQVDNLNKINAGIGSLLGAQSGGTIFKQGQASQGRQGGLLPLIGAGVGGYYGGAAGAKVGMGAGQYATQIG